MLKGLKPERFFLAAALALGIIYSIVVPPIQVPDENVHFIKAWHIAKGHMMPDTADKRIGGQLPVQFEELMIPFRLCTFYPGYRYNLETVRFAGNIRNEDLGNKFYDFPNVAWYTILSYLPQVVTIAVLDQMHVPYLWIYFAARLVAYLCWVLAMYFVIKMIPVFKWLFCALLLLPMQVYISNSFSGDVMNNILCFLFIAMVLKAAFADKPITTRVWICVLLIASLLACTKIIYSALVLMVLILPASKYRSQKHRILFLASMIIPFIISWLWSSQAVNHYVLYKDYHDGVRDYLTIHKEADYHAQKAHLFSHPFKGPEVVINSLKYDPAFYLRSYVGYFGLYMQAEPPAWLTVVCFVLLLLIATNRNNEPAFTRQQKVVLLGTGLLLVSGVILGLHLVWNKVGGDYIDKVPGRYLIPAMPFFFMLVPKIKLPEMKPVVVPGLVLFANIFCCKFIYSQFVEDNTIPVATLNMKQPSDKFGCGQKLSFNKDVAYLPPGSEHCFYQLRSYSKKLRVEAEMEVSSASGFYISDPSGTCHFNYYHMGYGQDSLWRKQFVNSFIPENCGKQLITIGFKNTGHDTIWIRDLMVRIRSF